MSGKSGQTQSSTTTTALPANQQQNADLMMAGARDLYATGGPKYYGGQTYAGTDPLQTQGRAAATNYAGGVGQDLVSAVNKGDQYWLNTNNVFNPSNIPGFNRAQEGVTSQVTNNLTRNILPQIRQGSIASGSLGGSRQGLGEALAVGETNRNLGDTLANMNMQAYGQGQSMYNSAAQRAPQTYGLGLAPAQTMETVGAQNQADVQKGIDANVARFNFDQLRPLMNLQALQGFTGSAGQYGGTNTSNTTEGTTGGGNQWMQGIGTLLTTIGAMYGGGKK